YAYLANKSFRPLRHLSNTVDKSSNVISFRNKKNDFIEIFFFSYSSLSLAVKSPSVKKIIHSLSFSLLFLAVACQQAPNSNSPSKIIIREKSDLATLNPVATSDQLSVYAGMHIFQTLTNIDFKTEKTVGVLAIAPPQIEYDSGGKMTATYTLRENASFGALQEVTFDDILFSIKINFCPLVSNSEGAAYYNFIEEVKAINQKTFTITCNSAAVLNELRSGDFFVLPKKHYDSLNLLQNFSLQRLKTDTMLKENDSIFRFAESFNSSLTKTNSASFIGSGPYKLKVWQKGERFILERKSNWWGAALKNENTFFKANTDELQFEIINDNQTAINALKSGEIDVLNFVSQSDYEKIKNSTNITTLECKQHGYNYIGFNCNNPILREQQFRKAIEASIPYQKIIEVVFQNQAELNRLPLAMQQSDLRNEEIVFENQNLEKAKKMLAELKWKDSNNNGILDRIIDGQLVECELQFHYNSGSEQRKAVGYLLKNELRKIGISLKVNELEWITYLKALRNNEVQIFISGKLTLPTTPDYTSSLHSSSANGGRNYANYQNTTLDTIIDSILMEPNKQIRTKMIKSVQEIVANDAPYIYLLSTKNRFAHSNRLQNVPIYSIRPHFWAAELY
ncbi:MAG: ABC transporter substrate-binding protein, partial [Vicingaceae bacterium]